MATFVKLSSGHWQARVRLKGHRQVAKAFETKALAREWAARTESAMRRGEMAAQRREHRRGALLDIPATKTDVPRTIPLSARAAAILDALPARLDGLAWGPKPDTLSHYFATAREAAGIVDLRLHDMRHEATSRLFERGLSVAEVASITGHSDWRMLKRYTQIRPEAVGRRLARSE